MKQDLNVRSHKQAKGIAARVVQLALFIIGIIACYQGALREIGWFGPTVVGLIVLYEITRNKQVIKPKLYILLYVGITGFVMESIMIGLGIYSVVESSRWLLPSPLAPLWIVALWVNYAARVPAFVVRFRGKHLINFIIGFVFAGLVYRTATSLGLVDLSWGWGTLAIIGLFWGLFVITIYLVAERQFRFLFK